MGVNTDDIVQAAVKYLENYTSIRNVLGKYTATGTPYLFQHSLWQNMEGTSSTAAVLTGDTGGWTSPNLHNTMRFPRLGLEITADPLRDSGGNLTEPAETMRRLYAAFDVFDKRLHRPQGGHQWWGSVRTVTCTRLAEPAVYNVAEGSGMKRLIVYYGVAVG